MSYSQYCKWHFYNDPTWSCGVSSEMNVECPSCGSRCSFDRKYMIAFGYDGHTYLDIDMTFKCMCGALITCTTNDEARKGYKLYSQSRNSKGDE